MDELDALKLLQKETKISEEKVVTDEKKEKRNEEWTTIISVCLLGIFIISILYTVIVHPIDRILIKMALIDSYAITTTAGGKTQTVLVDGNVICVDDKYYEIVDNGVYIYKKNADGKYTKTLSKSLSSDADTGWVKAVLDRKNYKRNILFWKPMEYTGDANILNMKDIETKVAFGSCVIMGSIKGYDIFGKTVHHYVQIQIHKFGFVHLRLPKVETK